MLYFKGPDPNPGDYKPRTNKTYFNSENCDTDEAVTAIRFGFAHPSDDESDLQNLQTQCTNAVSHITSGKWHDELVSDTAAPTDGDSCDANTIAVGLKFQVGRRGLSGLKLACVPTTRIIADLITPVEAIDPNDLPPLAVMNLNRPGGDMFLSGGAGSFGLPSSLSRPVNSPRECYQFCTATAGCAAWTYVKRGYSGNGLGYCYPKNVVSTGKPDFCCVAGVVAPLKAKVNTDRPRSDIGDLALPDTDPNLCAAACAGNPQCKAWTYTNPGVNGFKGPHCYLKNPAPGPIASNCCTSGERLALAGKVGTGSSTSNATGGGTASTKFGKLSRLGKLATQGNDAPASTQTLSVSCSSAGEVCNVPAVVNLQPGVWSVQVSAPSAHCSPIAYRLTTDNHGDLIGDTGALAPGAAGAVMPVPPATNQIYITATGIPGGCNTGTLSGWAVLVSLSPR